LFPGDWIWPTYINGCKLHWPGGCGQLT